MQPDVKHEVILLLEKGIGNSETLFQTLRPTFPKHSDQGLRNAISRAKNHWLVGRAVAAEVQIEEPVRITNDLLNELPETPGQMPEIYRGSKLKVTFVIETEYLNIDNVLHRPGKNHPASSVFRAKNSTSLICRTCTESAAKEFPGATYVAAGQEIILQFFKNGKLVNLPFVSNGLMVYWE